MKRECVSSENKSLELRNMSQQILLNVQQPCRRHLGLPIDRHHSLRIQLQRLQVSQRQDGLDNVVVNPLLLAMKTQLLNICTSSQNLVQPRQRHLELNRWVLLPQPLSQLIKHSCSKCLFVFQWTSTSRACCCWCCLGPCLRCL